MRCYTIMNSEATLGIDFQEEEDEKLFLTVGCSNTSIQGAGWSKIPLSTDFFRIHKNRQDTIRRAHELRGDEAGLRKFLIETTGKDTIDWEDKAEGIMSEDPDSYPVIRADPSTDGVPRLTKERADSKRALVLVCPESQGDLWYEANTCDEYLDERRGYRVFREQHEFPSPGVFILATGYGITGGIHMLVEMCPGSSFRICRNGNPRNISPVLIVAWPGSSLGCFPPKKFREQIAKYNREQAAKNNRRAA